MNNSNMLEWLTIFLAVLSTILGIVELIRHSRRLDIHFEISVYPNTDETWSYEPGRMIPHPRKTLAAVVVNPNNRPVQIVDMYYVDTKKEKLYLHWVNDLGLPKRLEEHDFVEFHNYTDTIEEYLIINRTEADYGIYIDSFCFSDLKVDIRSVIIVDAQGKHHKKRLPRPILKAVNQSINVRPDLAKLTKQKQLCCVEDCENEADYVVLIYDHSIVNGWVTWLDNSCPYICKKHQSINEDKAIGKPIPRSHIRYPFTKQRDDQGFVRYYPFN